jgi:hypothetical protein
MVGLKLRGRQLNVDKLKSALQAIVGERLVIVVGSGLSCAEGIAGMTEIANHLDIRFQVGLTSHMADEWATVGPAIKRDGLESALLKHQPSDELEKEIRRAIVDLIFPQESIAIESAISGAVSFRFSKLVPCLYGGNQATPIITTNYDRLIEVACEFANVPVDSMFDGGMVGWVNAEESMNAQRRFRPVAKGQASTYLRHHAKIIKPHGSLDWYDTPNGPRRYAGNLKLDRLVVSPGRGKYREGYNQPFDLHRREMNDQIDCSKRLMIIGYGFNDDHLETHLAPKIRQGIPTAVLTYGLTEKAKKLATENKNVIAIQNVSESECGIYFQGAYEVVALPPIWDLGVFVDEVLKP